MKPFARRAFLTTGLAAGAVPALVRARAQAAQYEFKMANNLPIEHPKTVGMSQMAAAVERETAGRVRIRLFPNSQLGGDAAMIAQLRAGALEFLSTDPGILGSIVPSAAITAIGCVFKTDEEALHATDGPLGEYIRRDIATAGMHVMPTMWDNGMREITSSTRPVRTPDDLAGFKIRTPVSRIWVDLFKNLGANPTGIDLSELYTSLQTHIVDGQEATLASDEIFRFYEVQKYLSLSNHMWAGTWMVANGDVWKRLPADIQSTIERNNTKYARAERRSVELLNGSLVDKLRRRGMIVNEVDIAPFQARLGSYYTYWKGQFGPTEWGLLESAVGKKLG